MTITTKHLGATNTRGLCIKATAHGQSLTVPFNYELSVPGNHEAAAKALMAKIDAEATLIAQGRLPNSEDRVYIFTL